MGVTRLESMRQCVGATQGVRSEELGVRSGGEAGPAPLTVKVIVSDWLRGNGFDGLCNEEQCGCHVNDLAPCHLGYNNMSMSCTPAYVGTDQLMYASKAEAELSADYCQLSTEDE